MDVTDANLQAAISCGGSYLAALLTVSLLGVETVKVPCRSWPRCASREMVGMSTRF